MRAFLPWSVRDVFDKMDRFGLIVVLIVIQIPPFNRAMMTVIFWLLVHVLRLPEL